eukprot:1939350-Amphidinium_carterae.1
MKRLFNAKGYLSLTRWYEVGSSYAVGMVRWSITVALCVTVMFCGMQFRRGQSIWPPPGYNIIVSVPGSVYRELWTMPGGAHRAVVAPSLCAPSMHAMSGQDLENNSYSSKPGSSTNEPQPFQTQNELSEDKNHPMKPPNQRGKNTQML